MWSHLWARQPSPPYALVVITAVVALVVVAYRPLWRLARNAITIAHEGGHALAAVLCGRRLQSIRLHNDTSGLTVTKGRPRGPGMVITLMIGYVAPSLLGIAGAFALAEHRITLLLWVAIVLLVAMLLMIRNGYGILAVLITGGIVFAISWYTSAQVQAAFAYAGVWFLLLGGVRPVFELAGQRRRGRARDSDVDQLGVLTHVPGGLWLGLFALVTLAALVLGSSMLDLLGDHLHALN
ncbi:MAG TPA: M50 family metallopeptidase [Micromonosporaceae bacterium]